MSRPAAFAPAALSTAAALLALAAAGCGRTPTAPSAQPGATAVPTAEVPGAVPPGGGPPAMPVPSTPAAPAAPAPALDPAALHVRDDPGPMLHYYAEALRRRDWAAAAKAWRTHSGVTADALKAFYDQPGAPLLDIGEGQVEGAAGSLYDEVPVKLRFGPTGSPTSGKLTLRRVNDVPGATAEQLDWRIERSTIGPGRPGAGSD